MSVERDLYFLNVTKYSKVVSVTLSVLEIVSTFPEEVRLVWSKNLKALDAVFLVNKYSPLFDTTVAITLDLFTYDPEACAIQYQVLTCSYIIGILFSECILLARTLALWRFDRFVQALLIGGAPEMVPLVVYITYDTVKHTKYDNTLHIAGGLPSTQDQDLWPAYMYMIIAETGIVFLTVLRWYLAPPVDPTRERIVITMYRDGSLFFAIVLALSIVNLLVMLLAPEEMSSFMQMPLRVVHSALCTRVLLNLREVAVRTSEGASTIDVDIDRYATTSITFNHSPTGPELEDVDDEDVRFLPELEY